MQIVQKGERIDTIGKGEKIVYAYTSGVAYNQLNDTNSVKAYIDTACNGHLVPIVCMTDIKVEYDMAVIGVGEKGLQITHSGFCNMLGGKGWAPKGNKYLVSMPQLDKLGCTSSTGNGIMKVYDTNGKVMLVGSMNKHDMYECRIEFAMKQHLSYNSSIDDVEQVIEVDTGKVVPDINVDIQGTEGNKTISEPKRYMNTMLRSRAQGARVLHRNMHHPNDKSTGRRSR